MSLSTFANVRRRQPPPFPSRESAPLDVLRAAFEESPHGVVVSGEDGTILFANVPASAMFAYPPGQLIGQPLSRLMPGAVPSAHDHRWTEFWANPRSAAMIADRAIVGIRHDGLKAPAEIGLSVFEDGSTRFVIASIVDITERLDLEARLAATANAHLGFQRLVADVVTRFGVIDPEAIDEATVDSLRLLGETLQLDCGMVWRWRSDGTVAPPVQHWVQPPYSPPEPFPIPSVPFVAASLKAGESGFFGTVDNLPEPDRAAFRGRGFRSVAVVPLTPTHTGDGEPELSALALGSMTREHEWPPAIIERLRLIAGAVGQAFARRASYKALQEALDEVGRLRDRLALENAELRREAKVLKTSRPVVAESPAILKVLGQIEQVAPTPATVLLLGETGTGKEVMAQAIHDLSPRHRRPMIRVSCAAIPTALIESELFGRERGAYTGALSRQIGRFEAANQGTLFLDEIGDLPMEVQVKLLRVLQERVIERLGSTQTIKVDVRIIAATNRSLEDAVRDKTFREDLYYRLNVFPVVVPPLRERVEDIPALVWSFIDEFSISFGKKIDSISKETMRELQRYSWPGNVRELRNIIERSVIVTSGRQLVVAVPRSGERPVPQTAMTMTELEVEHIRAVLESTNWRVRGSGGAAERLDIKPTTLESRMVRLGISRKKAG
jgi:PAS domain S-box-containing protein